MFLETELKRRGSGGCNAYAKLPQWDSRHEQIKGTRTNFICGISLMVSREGGTIRQLPDNDKTPPTYFFTLKMGRYEGSAEQV